MINKKKNFYNHDIQLTSDDIIYAADEEIRNLHDSLRRERDMTLRDGYDSSDVETSICYVQREIDIRENRRSAHSAYLKLNGYFDQTANNSKETIKSNVPEAQIH